MKRLALALAVFIILLLGLNLWFTMPDSRYDIERDLPLQLQEDIDNYVPIEKIPQDFINAVVAVEDERFYEHRGYDLISIGRALLANIYAGEVVQGGSTITQQLAKNLFLTEEKSLERKVRELILAIKLEKEYSKEEILEMYANVIYFGAGAYGLYEASQVYYQKDPCFLTVEECALLAGLPQAPSDYNPLEYPERAARRQAAVLNLMAEQGFISEDVRQ